jgi:solute carrier family 25 carnitine/acylcarnitine transporter 20/29
MSQSRPNQTSPSTQYVFNPYFVSVFCSNLALLVGHPAERLKVASQIKIGEPYHQMIGAIMNNPRNLLAGFWSCVYRQNIKIVYRSALMSEMPHRVDDLQLGLVFGSALKGFIASSIDTAMITPPENIKTMQMRTIQQVSIRETINEIYKTRGLNGFFYGFQPTIVKSFPTWSYLFMGYHATKCHREKQGFLATIMWATAASIPITIFTNPLDVVKTNMQASIEMHQLSMLGVAKHLIQKHGLFSMARGFPFRLVHKSLATTTAYLVMDMSTKFKALSKN